MPLVRYLNQELGIRTAVVSNGDGRIRKFISLVLIVLRDMTNKKYIYRSIDIITVGSVLKDLEFPDCLTPIVLSEEEGTEKPCSKIFMKTLNLVNQDRSLEHKPIRPQESLHVGDELVWLVLLLSPVSTFDQVR